MVHFSNENLSVVVVKCWFLGFVMRHRTSIYMCSVFSLYRNPDLDDRILDYLLTSMATVQAENVRVSFLFVCDLNGHHQECKVGFYNHKSHGVAAFDFATVSGRDQLVVGPTHARGGTLDLLMTDVPDLYGLLLLHP